MHVLVVDHFDAWGVSVGYVGDSSAAGGVRAVDMQMFQSLCFVLDIYLLGIDRAV